MKTRSFLFAIEIIFAWALHTVVFSQSSVDLASEIIKGENRQTTHNIEITDDPNTAQIIRYQSDFITDEDGWVILLITPYPFCLKSGK